jgi:glycosyltransferase involved in cell wall biosynthesis
MARLAWFSPMPPVATGVAACSADLVAALGHEHEIDVFVDEPVAGVAPGTRSAHDFVWKHLQAPYDLTVYQIGNSSHHDYSWPYLFRYPGLTVLHDACVHHARAACLLRLRRADDYRAEFAWNHPDANPDLAELAVAGFDNQIHYSWPMTRLLMLTARLIGVHSAVLADQLRHDVPGAAVEAIRLGQGTLLSPPEETSLKARGRAHYRIPEDAVVFGTFGGLTPEKRLPQVLAAFAAVRPYVPHAHLLLAGREADHYDLSADVRRRGLEGHTTLTGYLPTDDDFTECIAACDIALNLRWPTARELSGPWLRCLAAGKPTIVVDLAHLVNVPSLDPRTWQPNSAFVPPQVEPCCVAIDILDEDHSLRLAMRRLATDPALRATLGSAARDYWTREHSIGAMAADYRRVIALALSRPAPPARLPAHLVDDGDRMLRQTLEPFSLSNPLISMNLRKNL